MESNEPEKLPHEVMIEAIVGAEQRLRESYEQDAGYELGVADGAAALLALVMSSIPGATGTVHVDAAGVPVSGDVPLLKLMAMQYIGARALRVMRAARSTLASGYEAESRAHDRVLVELLEHRRAVLDDPSGKQARSWLEGKSGRGIGKRVAARSPEDLYKNLSHDSHGDPVPLGRLMDVETNTLKLEPQRTAATRASLLMHAGFARDQAAAIVEMTTIVLRGLDGLDAEIDEGWRRLEKEAGGRPTE
jgi:hypothetical protein